jgi:hypothetical protein
MGRPFVAAPGCLHFIAVLACRAHDLRRGGRQACHDRQLGRTPSEPAAPQNRALRVMRFSIEAITAFWQRADQA